MARSYGPLPPIDTVVTRGGAKYLAACGVDASEFGFRIADLLGELYDGLYHLDDRAWRKTDWKSLDRIHLTVREGGDWATFDFDMLTRFVVLCHAFCVRGSIAPASHQYLHLSFHRREREGEFSERHPTIEQAVARIRGEGGS